MHVLLVEDDVDVARLVVDWFDRQDDATVCVHRRLAGHVTDADIDAADVVLADLMMPFTDGCTFLARVAERKPSARRVLWTASPQGMAVCDAAEVVLTKPVMMDELGKALRGGR